MINNKTTKPCERCGQPADAQVVADGFDDAPESFTITRTCSAGCTKVYVAGVTPEEMRASTGLPLAGWSETRY